MFNTKTWNKSETETESVEMMQELLGVFYTKEQPDNIVTADCQLWFRW